MSINQAVPEGRHSWTLGRSRPRRVIDGLAFIAAWVTFGYLLPGGAGAYVLIGIPLTVAFQLLVRRRPLRQLWVRDGGTGSRLRRRDLAGLLVLAPLYWVVKATAGGNPWVVGWYGAAIAGAAYALRSTSTCAVLRPGVERRAARVGLVPWARFYRAMSSST